MLGLAPEALSGGLSDLHRLKLIQMDYETGEVFICDWFRFHKFASQPARGMLANAINKIESVTLKNEILLKSATCLQTKITESEKKPPEVAQKDVNRLDSTTCLPTSTTTSNKSKHTFQIPAFTDLKNESDGGCFVVGVSAFGSAVALDVDSKNAPPKKLSAGGANTLTPLPPAGEAKFKTKKPKSSHHQIGGELI